MWGNKPALSLKEATNFTSQSLIRELRKKLLFQFQ